MSIVGIECNRNKDIGTGYLSITVKSEWIKSPHVGFEPTTNQLTATTVPLSYFGTAID